MEISYTTTQRPRKEALGRISLQKSKLENIVYHSVVRDLAHHSNMIQSMPNKLRIPLDICLCRHPSLLAGRGRFSA